MEHMNGSFLGRCPISGVNVCSQQPFGRNPLAQLPRYPGAEAPRYTKWSQELLAAFRFSFRKLDPASIVLAQPDEIELAFYRGGYTLQRTAHSCNASISIRLRPKCLAL